MNQIKFTTNGYERKLCVYIMSHLTKKKSNQEYNLSPNNILTKTLRAETIKKNCKNNRHRHRLPRATIKEHCTSLVCKYTNPRIVSRKQNKN